METFAVFLNDQEHGPRQMQSLLLSNTPAKWVLVVSPPRMSRHLGRWLSQPAKKKWRMRWAHQALADVLDRIKAKGEDVEIRVVHSHSSDLMRQLRSEFANLRIFDARAAKDNWEVPAGAAVMGAFVMLASE